MADILSCVNVIIGSSIGIKHTDLTYNGVHHKPIDRHGSFQIHSKPSRAGAIPWRSIFGCRTTIQCIGDVQVRTFFSTLFQSYVRSDRVPTKLCPCPIIHSTFTGSVMLYFIYIYIKFLNFAAHGICTIVSRSMHIPRQFSYPHMCQWVIWLNYAHGFLCDLFFYCHHMCSCTTS